jgi:hypothetical protein
MAKGWISGGQHPDNASVRSKNTRRYGHDGSKGDFPHSSTGQQPAGPYRDPVAPSQTTIHHVGGPAMRHVETVGHLPNSGGQFAHATHPNADRKLHGGSSNTHAPLKPVGQAHSASGGQFGQPQTRPPQSHPSERGAQPAPHHGKLNQPRDRNR